jgi:glycosyltransferase involved in cell wall biosynthesis
MVGRLTMVAGDFVLTGGMDRANYALADYAARAGADVELVSHRVSPELASRPNVGVRRVRRPFGFHSLGEPLLDFHARRALRARRGASSVGVVNGGNCLAPDAVNWVHYVHAVYRERLRPELRALKHWAFAESSLRREQAALGRAALVIANSGATRRAVIERLGVEPTHVHTVYYGIDAQAFGPVAPGERESVRAELGLPTRPAVAFVGALGDRRKGFDTLFDAWDRLTARPSWDADLVVMGSGPELSKWRARARERKLDGRIHFLGFRKDVSRVLAACDALVAPTRYEAFGLGVAEALARGLPAIVSSRAGVAELFPERLHELLLDDVDSASELAERLLTWRERGDANQAPLAELTRRVRERSWDHMARDILTLCEGL